MADFFVSFTSADRQWAEWIAAQLQQAGYTVRLGSFAAGADFILEMQKATAEDERTIAVLSPAYLSARYTQPEWAAAVAADPDGRLGKLILVRVAECELKGILAQRVRIDLVGLDEAAARETLLSGVRREAGRPTGPPPFPQPAALRPRYPGCLPAIWNVPHRRNPNFTGREDILDALRTTLTSGQAAALTQAIVGLGGVGKTQTATEYAYRHCGDYDVVWWVRAEEPATLAAEYAALAGALNLPEKEAQEQDVIIAAVRRWLGQHGDWLLVFDNAETPDSLAPYLLGGGVGHVLITSRSQVWRGYARPLTVHVLPPGDAVDFLLKRTGQADGAAAQELA